MTCPKCGRETPRSGEPGRPRTYCSPGCRRAAEYELRRVQKALEGVEEQLRWCRFGWNGRGQSQVPKFDEERLRLERRLHELLDEEDVKQ